MDTSGDWLEMILRAIVENLTGKKRQASPGKNLKNFPAKLEHGGVYLPQRDIYYCQKHKYSNLSTRTLIDPILRIILIYHRESPMFKRVLQTLFKTHLNLSIFPIPVSN